MAPLALLATPMTWPYTNYANANIFEGECKTYDRHDLSIKTILHHIEYNVEFLKHRPDRVLITGNGISPI